jgi:hypothetical protein
MDADIFPESGGRARQENYGGRPGVWRNTCMLYGVALLTDRVGTLKYARFILLSRVCSSFIR